MATSGDEIYAEVDSELNSLSINTQPEVQNFRVPGERRSNAKSPTASNMATVLSNIGTTLGRYFISRRRVRRDALRLYKEGKL